MKKQKNRRQHHAINFSRENKRERCVQWWCTICGGRVEVHTTGKQTLYNSHIKVISMAVLKNKGSECQLEIIWFLHRYGIDIHSSSKIKTEYFSISFDFYFVFHWSFTSFICINKSKNINRKICCAIWMYFHVRLC